MRGGPVIHARMEGPMIDEQHKSMRPLTFPNHKPNWLQRFLPERDIWVIAFWILGAVVALGVPGTKVFRRSP